jgi:uncharacterized membrane protein YbhN (UPF0104 family)
MSETQSPQPAVERAVPDGPDDRRRWARIRRPRTAVLVCGIGVLIIAAGVSAVSIDRDSGSDLWGLLASTVRDVGRLRWQYAAAVAALAGMHYVATAVAARAAAGLRLDLGETVLVQLSCAAANRITPAGLGGSAVNARFFTRRGLDAPAAVGAVTALAVLGAVADLLVSVVIVLGGRWLGLRGAASEVAALTAKLRRLVAPLHSLWWWAVAVAGIGIAVWLARTRARRRRWMQFWTPVRRLARSPRRLVTLLAASGLTTLILGVAFAASTAMVPGPQPRVPLGALLIAFVIGAAAGSSVPTPAGLGSTEAALVAVVVSTHVPAAHAVQQVLIFRLITFWTPAIVGVLTIRPLTRRGAL